MSKRRKNNNITFRFVKRYYTDFYGSLFSKGFFVRWCRITSKYKIMFKNIKVISQRIKDRLLEKLDRRVFLSKQFKNKKSIKSKNLNYFNYRVDLVKLKPKRKRRTLFSKRLRERHKLRNFASQISITQYKSYVNKSRSSTRLIPFFYSLFETRIDHIIFRMNLAYTSSYNRQSINHKNFLINDKLVYSSNQKLNFSDIFSVKDPLFFYLFLNKRLDFVIEKINKKAYSFDKRYKRTFRVGEIFMNIPAYFEINYRIFSCMMIFMPSLRHLYYPFNFNKAKFASFGRRFV